MLLFIDLSFQEDLYNEMSWEKKRPTTMTLTSICANFINVDFDVIFHAES